MGKRPTRALLLGGMLACSRHPGVASRADLDASIGRAGTPDASDEGPPVVEVTLPSCPTSPLVPLPAGTDPTARVDVRVAGGCSRFCVLDPTIPCNDAGETWSTSTLCSCDRDASWSCVSDYPLQPSSCGAPAYACASQPLLYSDADAAAQLLPSGSCNAGAGCTVRTRERCADGTTGVTSAYACDCPQSGPDFGRWQCNESWATLATCDGGVAEAGYGAIPDAGGYWIEVQGDGASYVMSDRLMFASYAPSCGTDSTLTGCFAAGIPPCITSNVTPGNHGSYVDREGNYWALTSTSIQLTADGNIEGGAGADGTLVVTGVSSDGKTMQLTITFHTPLQSFVC